MRLNHAGLLCALVGVPFVATQAVAADAAQNSRDTASSTLEEVIVTAERRTGDVQKTAASVSVRTGEELAAQGRYTTRQILEDVPGISAVENASVNVGTGDVQGNNITIRGIAPGASASGGPQGLSAAAGAAVYVDGVYEGVGSGYDIDRVEVLRGPQGTLYGRSATTGVVAFHTRNPSMDGFSGNAGVEVGNYDLKHVTAGVNIPLATGLAARVSGDFHDQGKGYYDIASRGISKRTNGRAKLLWQPSDALSLLVGVAYEKRQDSSGGNSTTARPPTLVETTTTRAKFPAYKQQRQYWLEANWNVGPVTLTYLPAIRTWDQDDNNFVSSNFLSSGAAQFQLFRTNKDNFLTHELRVASREGSRVQWQAGAFYYRNTLENSNDNYLTPNGGHVPLSITHDLKDTKNVGYFAEATIPLSTSVRTTLGVRYDDTDILVNETLYDNLVAFCGTSLQNIPGRLPAGTVCTGVGTSTTPVLPGVTINVPLKFHNFNYKARIEYDLTPKNLLFGMISTGFRPGDAGVVSKAPNILASEKLTSIEIGSKNRFLDDSLQLNVGVYYYNYKGFQTSYIADTPSPTDYVGGPTAPATRLTVPARNLGGELEILYRVTPHDRVGINYNYVQSKWYDKPAGFAAAQTEEKRALTPYTATANYEHVFNLSGGSTLSARIDGRYEAAHVTQNLHIDLLRIGFDQYAYVHSRVIGNLSAGWASMSGRYSVDAYVRNFTDKKYTTYGVGGDVNSLTVTWTDPRTYGAQFNARF
jgi:outer membrane receptor protein involved in Fe transport